MPENLLFIIMGIVVVATIVFTAWRGTLSLCNTLKKEDLTKPYKKILKESILMIFIYIFSIVR